jgi:hypothetical protein
MCLINSAPFHEDVRRSGGIAPPFLTSVQDRGELHAPTALPQNKSRLYPMQRRVGRPQTWNRSYEVDKSISPVGNRSLAECIMYWLCWKAALLSTHRSGWIDILRSQIIWLVLAYRTINHLHEGTEVHTTQAYNSEESKSGSSFGYLE